MPGVELGLVLGDLAEQHVRARDEHARVPQVRPVREVRLRRLEVGLLDEALDERRLGRAVDHELRALLDVAEADRRLRRLDADRADVSLARGRHRLPHRPVEQVRHPDHVVGGERADDDVGFAPGEDRRGEPDGSGGVTRLGFEDDVLVRDAGQLLLDGRPVRAPGDDGDPVGAGERLEPVPGVAQQRLAGAGEIVQELGGVGARERPQPAPDPAGGDDGVEVLDGLWHAPRVIGGGRATRAPAVASPLTTGIG